MSVDAPSGTALVSTFSFASTSYDTLGEVCDYLNAHADLTCTLTGGKRDDAPALTWNTAALQASGSDIAVAGGYSVLIGTGAVGLTTAVDETISWINRIGITPESGMRVVLKYCNGTNDGTGTIKVYGKIAKYGNVSDGVTRNDTTLVSSIADVDDTAKTVGNIYGGYWIEFAKDAHVVISAGNASTAQTATSSL